MSHKMIVCHLAAVCSNCVFTDLVAYCTTCVVIVYVEISEGSSEGIHQYASSQSFCTHTLKYMYVLVVVKTTYK